MNVLCHGAQVANMVVHMLGVFIYVRQWSEAAEKNILAVHTNG